MQKLIDGLHKFKAEVFDSSKELLQPLVNGQRPEVLFVSCADCRVAPDLITQTDPGELFILRNAGNIVPPFGVSSSGEAAALELALLALGVRHIIVCGHTNCSAMSELIDPRLGEDAPALRAWLTHAEAARRVVEENYPDVSGPARLTVTVEENVLAQIEHLRSHPAVRVRVARGELSLHGWVYKMETGEVFQYDPEQAQFVAFVQASRSSSMRPEAPPPSP